MATLSKFRTLGGLLYGGEPKVPGTEAPTHVLGQLSIMALILWAVLCWLLGGWIGTIIFLGVMAATTNIYTVTVNGFEAGVLLNALRGTQRSVARGLHPKLPWESLQVGDYGEFLNLRVQLHEVMGPETYPSSSKKGSILGKYIYSFMPDDSSGEAIVRFVSFSQDAIKQAARALFSMRLSDYFRDKEKDEEILDKEQVNRKVFLDPADPRNDPASRHYDPGHPVYNPELRAFAKKHGLKIEEVRLEDVDFSEEIQQFRDLVAKSISFADAVTTLRQTRPQISETEAAKIVRLMGFPNVHEHILTAPDLQNMHTFAIGAIPGVGGTPTKGGKP